MPLFGPSNIDGPEREKVIRYCQSEWRLAALVEKYANVWDDSLAKNGNANPPSGAAMKELQQAVSVLKSVAAEAVKRRATEFKSVPPVAAPVASLWDACYYFYQGWADAQASAIEAIASGQNPNAYRVASLFAQEEAARRKAQEEESKLIKRLRMDAGEYRGVFQQALQAGREDAWKPVTISS